MGKIGKKELSEYCLRLDLIQATAKQIIKDFSLFDETIKFSGNTTTAYEELYTQIFPIIDRLINLDSSRFFAMLYAIDIEEKKIKKLLFGNEPIAVVQEITKLIIERELIKVVYRKHWSKAHKNEP